MITSTVLAFIVYFLLWLSLDISGCSWLLCKVVEAWQPVTDSRENLNGIAVTCVSICSNCMTVGCMNTKCTEQALRLKLANSTIWLWKSNVFCFHLLYIVRFHLLVVLFRQWGMPDADIQRTLECLVCNSVPVDVNEDRCDMVSDIRVSYWLNFVFLLSFIFWWWWRWLLICSFSSHVGWCVTWVSAAHTSCIHCCVQ